MRVVTGQEMARLDAASIAAGMPAAALMESAGAAAAAVAMEMCGEIVGKRVHVLCGTGNNGGDGFVVARRLANAGARVRVYLLGEATHLSGSAAQYYNILGEMGLLPSEVRQVNEPLRITLTMADLIVDAMLGIGARGAPHGVYADMVDAVNAADRPVLALDVPTGVDANTGQVAGVAVQATQTVTFGLLKLGLLLQPGAGCAGRVRVVDIGFPAYHLTRREEGWAQRFQLTSALLASWRPQRPCWAHKGSFGRVMLVAGSAGMLGAGALAATAALRTGVGQLKWAGPQSLWPVMATKVTEATTQGLPEGAAGRIGKAAIPLIKQHLAGSSALAIGPGLGRSEETLSVVRQICEGLDIPAVIDADGLHALVGVKIAPDQQNETAAKWVLTPHPGEAAVLLGSTVAQIESDRPAAVVELANKYNSVVVLKGVPTLITAPGGAPLYINCTGNPGMATGGSGDVLTGVIAALIAQGMPLLPAAAAGVYLHGLAGDVAATGGAMGLMASDIVTALPAALAACWETNGGAAS